MPAPPEPARPHAPPEALRALESAARLGSFKAAAIELSVTPAAISQRIRSLEDHLGASMFVRLNRGLRLTDAGRDLAAALREAFTIMDRAVGAASGDVGPSSTVTIAVLPSFAVKCLVPRLQRFYARHPSVRVHIEASDVHVDLDRERRYDVAVRYGPGPYPGLLAERLGASRTMAPVCRTGAAAMTGSPLDWTLLHTDRSGLGASDWRDWFRLAGWPEAARDFAGPTFSNAHLAIEAAIAGQGVALVPALLAADDLGEGRLIRAAPIAVPDACGFWLLRARNRSHSPAVQLVRHWLLEEFGSDAVGVPDETAVA